MRRLLALVPTPGLAASTRFRVEQFVPWLERAGIATEVRPFLDEKAFRLLYEPGIAFEKVLHGARALQGRLTDLVRASRADAVLIHREAALVGPPVLEWLITRLNRPIIFDIDDAVWEPYASPTYGALLSRLMKMPSKTHFTLRVAAHVLVGNRYLADYAGRFSSQVSIVPTVVDTEVFRPAAKRNDIPVLGWIGTHSTAPYLQDLVPVLRQLARTRRFLLRVVGAQINAEGVPCECVPWALEREVADFQALDVGLYPLRTDKWALGKSGFKAVQYMACGVPVVASPVGATTDMIAHGENGYLASTADEWLQHLERLLDDRALRERVGAAGRQHALERWSAAVHAPTVLRAIADACDAAGRTANRS